MKNCLFLILLLCAALVLLGCLGSPRKRIAKIELEGNPTTGYTWVYNMPREIPQEEDEAIDTFEIRGFPPEDIVRKISSDFVPHKSGGKIVGSGGKFVFTFEGITPGETELVFSYLRAWEMGIPPVETVTYRATVNEKKYLTITRKMTP